MTVLVDTHIIAWMAAEPHRLSATARDALRKADRILLSAVIAFEYDDLVRRGRLAAAPLTDLLDPFEMTIIDYPADCALMAVHLPNLHRDPVDRMLIAHALHLDTAVITADTMIPRYPVRTIW